MDKVTPNGFVSVEFLHSVFGEEVSKLEEDYRRQGVPDVRTIFEHIDNIKLRLMQRANFNIEEYLRLHPETRKKQHEEKQALNRDVQKTKWEDRVKSQKQAAINSALEYK